MQKMLREDNLPHPTMVPITKYRRRGSMPMRASIDIKGKYLNFAWENDFDTLWAFYQFYSCQNKRR